MNDTQLQNQLPLTEATFLILLSLAISPRHGYAIMQDVAELSEGRIHFSTGTLYGALKRLLQQGWIERVELLDVPETARPQKHYRLTEQGQRILDAEAQRLRSLARLVQLRLRSANS
jgi:DNA-binding PadR family transcriptional regulator